MPSNQCLEDAVVAGIYKTVVIRSLCRYVDARQKAEQFGADLSEYPAAPSIPIFPPTTKA